MITYTVMCDECMYEHANQSDRCPDVSTVECENCGTVYCEMCPEELKQCQQCGIMLCSCTEFTSNGCEHCDEEME